MTYSSLEHQKIKAKLLQKKKNSSDFALKDAYALLAKAAGHASWKEMKDVLILGDLLNPRKWSAITKSWFSSREDALSHLKPDEFLLPYHREFFICKSEHIEALGIDPFADPDVRLTGHDWSAPQDLDAFKRLIDKIKSQKT